MSYIALQEPGTRIRTGDLSKAIEVSAPYLSKIMGRLSANGIVDARKGHNGGFVLARPAAEIRFIDILRAVDFEPGADHCLFGLGNCDSQNPCPLHHEWSILKQQIEDWARSHTLAESIRSGSLDHRNGAAA